AEQSKLQLRGLNREQVADRLWQWSEAVDRRRLELGELVLRLGEHEPPVQVDLLRLGRDVLRRHVGVDPRVDPNRAGSDPPFARELGDGLTEQLDVELEAER